MKLGIRIAIITPIVGTTSDDRELQEKFIENQAPEVAKELSDEVLKQLEKLPKDEQARGRTLFTKDAKGIYLRNYQLLGYLKAAGEFIRKSYEETAEESAGKAKKLGKKWGSIRSKISQFVTIAPWKVYLKWNDGEVIQKPTGCVSDLWNHDWAIGAETLQRPLLGQTMQGPRVALANSEVIEPTEGHYPTLRFVIDIPDHGPITKDMLVEMLDKGKLKCGLLQWRNAGYGRFDFEIIDAALVDEGPALTPFKTLPKCA